MNYTEANNALFSMFWPVFKAQCEIVLGYAPKVYWPDKKEDDKPPTDQLWLRVSRQTVQRSLSGFGQGDNTASRLYTVPGILFVQLFYPQSDTESATRFPMLAEFLSNLMLEKHSSDNLLWTRQSTVKEVTSENNWFRKNVVVNFEYQDFH